MNCKIYKMIIFGNKKVKKLLTKGGQGDKILTQQSGMVRSHLNGFVRAVNNLQDFFLVDLCARIGSFPSVL